MTPISKDTCTQAWFAGVKHLEQQDDWCDYTMILEIASPLALAPGDREAQHHLDGFLKAHDRHAVNTVVNTIFPAGLYLRHGGSEVLSRYKGISAEIEGHDDVKWGTYALRMTSHTDANGKEFSPLKALIEKLAREVKSKGAKKAAYELNLIDPVLDLPIYDCAQDRKYCRGGPCLSHLSFKLRRDHKLILTAFYRSHHYVQRALGNLYGLAWLQHFVAEQAGIGTGELVCISSMATLETGKEKNGSGWTQREVKSLINECAVAYDNTPAIIK